MTAHHSLRCVKCLKEWEHAWIMSGFHSIHGIRDSTYIRWRNVVVVGETKNGTPKCECKNCGHRYNSDSSAARRALRFAKERGELPGGDE